jgi:hypothetical protein
MVTICAVCDMSNPEDGRFCTWCGAAIGVHEVVAIQSPLARIPAQPVAMLPIVEPISQQIRVWLPNQVLAYDQWGESYPAVEWQQYELTY